MKALTLTPSLIAALTLSSLGQTDATLRSQISLKEKELVQLQQELAALKGKLTTSQTATNSTTYKVKTGDTISSIARRHGVSSNDLMGWNKITDPTRLGIGEVLTIQTKTPQIANAPKAVRISEAPKTAQAREYTIQKGDTFYSIARTHKLTVTQLRQLNPDVSTHLITAGAKLRVSGTPAVAAAPKPEAKKAAPTIAAKKPAPPATPKVEVKTAKVTPPPAAKKEVSTSLTTSTTQTVKAEVPAKKKTTTTASTGTTTSTPPPLPPVVEEKQETNKTGVTTIILADETTFNDFATKHATSTDQLNALNGWNLPKATVLARGSEIHVPQ